MLCVVHNTKTVDTKMRHTIAILILQIEWFQSVVTLPAAAYLLFWVSINWRHRRCIDGILIFSLRTVACLCYYYRGLFNSVIVAQWGGYNAIAVSCVYLYLRSSIVRNCRIFFRLVHTILNVITLVTTYVRWCITLYGKYCIPSTAAIY